VQSIMVLYNRKNEGCALVLQWFKKNSNRIIY